MARLLWTLAKSGALADRFFQPIVGASSANDMFLTVAKRVFDDNQYGPNSIGHECSFISQQVDVTVSSLGNAKSLRGGTLLLTPLKGADGQVYALSQGNVLVGGVGASASGSSVTVNHLSVGRIAGRKISARSTS